MLKRDGWQALQEAEDGGVPRQLEFSFSFPPKESDKEDKHGRQSNRPYPVDACNVPLLPGGVSKAL